MHWMSRDFLSFERMACCWLITRFVDFRAQLVLVADEDLERAQRSRAIPFALYDHDTPIVFGSLLDSFGLRGNRALSAMADLIRGCARAPLLKRSEADSLQALFQGLEVTCATPQRLLSQAFLVCDAIYAGLCERLEVRGWAVSSEAPRRPRRWSSRRRKVAAPMLSVVATAASPA